MRLNKLTLNNFQGIKEASYQMDGKSVSIYGDNATGKTTIFNALTWLLFDKASTNVKNFTPKTKGPDGDLHYLDHSAEGSFILEDGRQVTFTKTYHEIYKKQRGSSSEEFSGHTTDYFIDGVPSSEKEYQAALNKLSGLEAEGMKMLTVPNYFPEEMTWDARRKILLDMCGDVTDEDVINANSELKEINNFLLMPGTTDQYYSVDEYKKIASAKKNEINNQIKDIPGRIDEATRAIPDLTGIDVKTLEKEIAKLKGERSDLETEKAQMANGDFQSIAIRKKVAEAVAELAEARNIYSEKARGINDDINRQIQEARERLSEASYNNNASALSHANIELEDSKALREELSAEYKEVQKEVWDDTQSICPTCHQELPEEDVEKLKAAFNTKKSQKLEAINLKGKQRCSKEMIEELEAKIKDIAIVIGSEMENEKIEEEKIANLKAKLVTPIPFEETPEYKQLNEKLNSLKAEDVQKDTVLTDGYSEKIEKANTQIREKEELITRVNMADVQKVRITELKDKEKDLAKSYEELEKGVYLCEQFIKAKVSMLEGNINDRFQNVRFRLFQEQINGGIKEDCEVMIPTEAGQLVPFAFSNNAARLNAGLEIVDSLSKHWGVSMPVFVDNAESVVELNKIDAQVIRLVVSGEDKKLRMEIE